MKYNIITLGCKVNSYESESYALILENNGYEKCEKDADVVIVNTCSVTSTSDQKSRQMIRRIHSNNPNAILLVSGCYSQIAYEEISKIEGVNIIIGSSYKNKIIDLIKEFKKSKKQIIKVEDSNKLTKYEEIKVDNYSENTRAFVKIQDGCNNFCSYCIIPYARGRSRSRSSKQIIIEINKLVKNGFKEVVLTGIDTANYGEDLNNYKFVDLLKDILKFCPKLERLRISSIEASQINNEFIELLKTSKIIVPHLHIPLQSGCDETLKRMNRKYDTKFYYNVIKNLKRQIKNISITTDLIVGFPGEDDNEFNKTYKFVKKCGFTMVHVFPYSRRSGTVADRMENQIKPETKKEREKKIFLLASKLTNRYLRKLKNTEVEVLFETFDRSSNTVSGHCEYYLKVEAKGCENIINKICKVKIKKPGYPISFGDIIK